MADTLCPLGKSFNEWPSCPHLGSPIDNAYSINPTIGPFTICPCLLRGQPSDGGNVHYQQCHPEAGQVTLFLASLPGKR